MNNYLNMVNSSNSINKEEISFWITHNLINHLEKYPEIIIEIEHILDFFVSQTSTLRLRKVSYNQAKDAAEKWIEKLNKKSNDIVELDQDVEIILNFEDGYKIIKLVGEAAFKREGLLMSHCVSSYFNRENSHVYSLRDENNTPHATIEVNRDDINQIKGKGNGHIHPKYIAYVIKILQYFKMEVRESELGNLGYIKLNKEQWKFLDDNYKGIKHMTFNNTKLFYINSSLIVKA